jgi:hypothetical protein
MKSCPACNRTFEDTFTFCLVDGSILSAPFDPQATREIHNRRTTNPPPTEVMLPPNLPNSRDALPPTMRSPQPGYAPSPSSSAMPNPGHPPFFQGQYIARNTPQKKTRLWIVSLVLFVLWFFGLALGIGGVLIHLLFIAALSIMVIYLINKERPHKSGS